MCCSAAAYHHPRTFCSRGCATACLGYDSAVMKDFYNCGDQAARAGAIAINFWPCRRAAALSTQTLEASGVVSGRVYRARESCQQSRLSSARLSTRERSSNSSVSAPSRISGSHATARSEEKCRVESANGRMAEAEDVRGRAACLACLRPGRHTPPQHARQPENRLLAGCRFVGAVGASRMLVQRLS